MICIMPYIDFHGYEIEDPEMDEMLRETAQRKRKHMTNTTLFPFSVTFWKDGREVEIGCENHKKAVAEARLAHKEYGANIQVFCGEELDTAAMEIVATFKPKSRTPRNGSLESHVALKTLSRMSELLAIKARKTSLTTEDKKSLLVAISEVTTLLALSDVSEESSNGYDPFLDGQEEVEA